MVMDRLAIITFLLYNVSCKWIWSNPLGTRGTSSDEMSVVTSTTIVGFFFRPPSLPVVFQTAAYGLKMGSTVNEVVAMWLRREPCHSTGQGLGNERLDPPASLAWDGITHVP